MHRTGAHLYCHQSINQSTTIGMNCAINNYFMNQMREKDETVSDSWNDAFFCSSFNLFDWKKMKMLKKRIVSFSLFSPLGSSWSASLSLYPCTE
mmetsp:Transcript_34471/g.63418  ORF Transcript_34471/g.63418 Transcript_34471/m.63418 type:complete len:94 (-) Transcript_34471:203-484(-)